MFLFVQKAAPKFCSSFALVLDFVQCTFLAGFRNNFQDQGRLSKQLLESQAAVIKPEQAP
jgi:hypothetical protein